MPTYMLEGAAEVKLNVRPLSFTLRIQGTTAPAWLEVTAGGLPVESVVRPANMVILPSVDSTTMISVVPIGMERFPSPTIAHLSITVEDRAADDPQRVILAPVDVSGLDRKDLVFVEQGDGVLLVRAAHNQSDADLGRLGNAARVATREILGLQWLQEDTSLNVLLAVDGSGSTVDLMQDGTVGALAQVLAGVSQVVANGKAVSAAIVGDSLELLPPVALQDVAESLSARFQDRLPSSGFRSASPLERSHGLPSQQLVYLLTDGVPADARDLSGIGALTGEVRHIVAVTEPAAWRLLGGTETPHTVVEPATETESLEGRLLRDPRALAVLVRSLLQACFPAGSPLAERVNQ